MKPFLPPRGTVRNFGMTMAVALLAMLGACSRGSDAHPDDALKSDLALAAQAQPYAAQQFVGPNEMSPGATAPAPQYNATPRAPQAVRRTSSSRRSTARSSSRGVSRSSGDGGYYPSVPSAPPEPVRHTERDAAIGAAAGAVIGATTSNDRIKGGIVGAAAGGILGGIIGHTVDVQKP